ncbi:MAG: hypothetical protein ACXU9O_16130 [Gemmatimonadaceae bacterium]
MTTGPWQSCRARAVGSDERVVATGIAPRLGYAINAIVRGRL